MYVGFGTIIFVILALAVLEFRKRHRLDAHDS
jgi:hypothetical protein